MRLATGPVTWGVDFADTPSNPPWELVLDEIAASGVGALELGPVGYLPEDPSRLRAALDERDLVAVGSFIFDDLHVPHEAAHVLEAAERACRAIAAAGGSVLVIIDRPGPERAATAGRSDAARRLADDEWAALLEVTNRVADVALQHGLRPAFHPHVGGFVEFEDEIARLVADTNLALCLDTGHCAYAGVAPEQVLAAYGSRLGHVHLKDVRDDVLARVRADALGFWDAIEAGVFCPLGEGVVDFAACRDALRGAGYDGFATIEQDRVPGSGSPLDDLRRSLRVLDGWTDTTDEATPMLARDAQRVLDAVASWPAIDEMTVEQARSLEQRRKDELAGPPELVGAVEELEVVHDGLTVPVRIYRPIEEPAGTLVWLHGGGWVLGSPELSDDQNRAVTNASGCVVVAVDYRLAPEHRFPAAVHDVVAVLRWAAEHDSELGATGKLVIGGDSAGGNLTAAATLMARDAGGPQADLQVLIYPALCRDLDASSRVDFGEDHWITVEDLAWFWDLYLERDEDARHPYASPLLADSLAGLPPAYVLVAQCDVLRDEGVRYAQRLREDGVPVELHEEPGMLHGFLACGGIVERAPQVWTRVGDAIRQAVAVELRSASR